MASDSKIKELLKHFSVYGIGSIAQAAAGFILIPIITKYLSPADYGIYTLISLVGVLAGTIFYFGITTALPRSYFDHEDDSARNRVLSTALALVGTGAILQIILAFSLGRIISVELFGTDEHSGKLILMLIGSAVSLINTFLQTYFRLLNKSKLVVYLGLVASLVNFFVAIFLLKITSLSIWVPILSYFLGQMLVFLFSIYQVRNAISSGFDRAEASLMMKLGLPAVLTSIAVVGMEWSDRFFINKFLSLSDVGIYSLAYKFGSIVSPLLIFPFVQIWNPLMMKYRESADVVPFFTKVFDFYFGACAIFILLFISCFSEVSSLIIANPDYHKAFFIIPMIMLGASVYGSVNFLAAGFFYKRNIKEIPIIYFVFSVLSVLLNFLLIPKAGYWGAAVSNFLIYSTLPIVIYYRSKQYFNFKINLLRILCIIGICTSLSYLIINLQHLDPALRLTLRAMILLLGVLFVSFLILDKHTAKILLRGKFKEALNLIMN